MSTVLFFGALAIVLFMYGAHRKYRGRVPVASRITEADVRRRTYPNGAVVYYFSNRPVPFYEFPFVLTDLRTLRRQNVLEASLEYVDRNGYIIPETPEFQASLSRYHRLLERFFECHGPESRLTQKVLRQAPFAYQQELYSLKRSAKQSSIVAGKPSFS